MRPGSQDDHNLSRSHDDSGQSASNTVNTLIATTESAADADAAQGVGLKLICAPVSTAAAVHGRLWDAVEPAIQKDDEADQRCTVGWSITGARSMLFQATVMATVRAAADNALKSARAVCLDGGRMKPNIGRSAWPAPSTLSHFDFHLEDDLQAIDSATNDATIAASEHMQHFNDDDGCTTTVQDAEFHPPHPHRDKSTDDQAGPATTLHARLSSIQSDE